MAGLGLLIDWAGNDQYRGAKLTQGSAIGGLGLLLDKAVILQNPQIAIQFRMVVVIVG